MSFFSKIFSRDKANAGMRPLYQAIVREGRQIAWYEEGQVPDSLDGRFDMIAAIFSLVMIRLEKEPELNQQVAWLTEIFISDMDGQLRQIGIGDMVVSKHVGRIMGALGGRVGPIAMRWKMARILKMQFCAIFSAGKNLMMQR